MTETLVVRTGVTDSPAPVRRLRRDEASRYLREA